MEGGDWWATVHGVRKESNTTERLHFHFHYKHLLIYVNRFSHTLELGELSEPVQMGLVDPSDIMRHCHSVPEKLSSFLSCSSSRFVSDSSG